MKDTKYQLSLKMLLLILGGLVGFTAGKFSELPVLKTKGVLTPQAAKVKVEKYIESIGADNVEVTSIKDDKECIYTITLASGSQNFTSYMSKDGSKLFQGALTLDDAVTQPVTTEAPKGDKPKVELFVMSHCPYGTQIEKGMLSVLDTLGDKIDFELKFCDYAMHGETELQEQLRQYCIQEQGKDKILTYLECFLADGDSASCVQATGVDTARLATCTSQTDSKYGVTVGLQDKSLWVNGNYPPFDVFKEDTEKYGVAGSPTLVINGQQVSPAGRDSASLLATICSGFNEQPQECNVALSSESPAPGFGFGTTAGGTDASCN